MHCIWRKRNLVKDGRSTAMHEALIRTSRVMGSCNCTSKIKGLSLSRLSIIHFVDNSNFASLFSVELEKLLGN